VIGFWIWEIHKKGERREGWVRKIEGKMGKEE
jgi:hypothetical protein